MEVQNSDMGRTRSREIDCERKRKYGQYEPGGQPVHQSRGPIKDPSFGITDRAHRSVPQMDWLDEKTHDELSLFHSGVGLESPHFGRGGKSVNPNGTNVGLEQSS
jgi:hypothetical protein